MAKPPKGSFGRAAKMFGAVAKVAGKEVANRISGAAQKKYEDLTPEQIKRRVDQARALTTSLKQLRGAAMKVGQLISLDASGYLPPEAVEILSELQNQAVAWDPLESTCRHASLSIL